MVREAGRRWLVDGEHLIGGLMSFFRIRVRGRLVCMHFTRPFHVRKIRGKKKRMGMTSRCSASGNHRPPALRAKAGDSLVIGAVLLQVPRKLEGSARVAQREGEPACFFTPWFFVILSLHALFFIGRFLRAW
jgi:hypothetical protein